MTALISRTIQDTRFTLRQRTEELATQNAELSVARNTAVGLARVSELHELVRVVYESARTRRGRPPVPVRVKADFADGFHGRTGRRDPGVPRRPTLPEDMPRRRAVREKRTVAVNDAGDDKGADRARTTSTSRPASSCRSSIAARSSV